MLTLTSTSMSTSYLVRLLINSTWPFCEAACNAVCPAKTPFTFNKKMTIVISRTFPWIERETVSLIAFLQSICLYSLIAFLQSICLYSLIAFLQSIALLQMQIYYSSRQTYIHFCSLKDLLHLLNISVGSSLHQLLIDVTWHMSLKQFLQQRTQPL